ncbi:hypothetical protein SODALDRAFT_326385 [Sodiomyces alkalinus F11]|uniref:Uncharacterized protein n=1 Tax=Sodiomyces alkalinus (strain CBS 110278 / VKM F-3762 / F11) TaxID=1314773 RepID=A0A3N2Q671_SODAK|nr:hypothetical protein SODALDRAFT_326385 [Sodiomyces alkalinus F11]ROT42206.1 hypothetical protein SODALDRAFT_326385 [Sodiomyces alkalinus F11]
MENPSTTRSITTHPGPAAPLSVLSPHQIPISQQDIGRSPANSVQMTPAKAPTHTPGKSAVAKHNSKKGQTSGAQVRPAPQAHGPNRRHTRASARATGEEVVQGLDQRGRPPPEAFQVVGIPGAQEEEVMMPPGETHHPPSTPSPPPSLASSARFSANMSPSPPWALATPPRSSTLSSSAPSIFSLPSRSSSESAPTSLSGSSTSATWTSTYTTSSSSGQGVYSPSVSSTVSLSASQPEADTLPT